MPPDALARSQVLRCSSFPDSLSSPDLFTGVWGMWDPSAKPCPPSWGFSGWQHLQFWETLSVPCWSPLSWLFLRGIRISLLALSWVLAAAAPPVVLVVLETLLTDVGAVTWWRVDSPSPRSASPVASTPTWPHHLCPSAPFGTLCNITTFLAAICHVLMAF